METTARACVWRITTSLVPPAGLPRGSIHTTIMELGPKRPSLLWFWDPNSIIGVYMDPLGYARFTVWGLGCEVSQEVEVGVWD